MMSLWSLLSSFARVQLLALLIYHCLFSSASALESVDVYKPILKLSPALLNNSDLPHPRDDWFGYSVTVHQLFSDPSGLTMEQILDQTLIMVGAPKGGYPGGFNTSQVEPDKRACEKEYSDLDTLTTDQILDCYRNTNTGTTNRTGLVYQCPLSSPSCSAVLGSGDAGTPDGFLFDRVGNAKIYLPLISSGLIDLLPLQNKNGQLMGATVRSEDGYFVACAPLWEFVDTDFRNSQPRGHCVYSNRSLTDFLLLQPCDISGSSSNHQREGYCEAGFSVSMSNTFAQQHSGTVPGPFILTGTPGRRFSAGGVFFYNRLNDTSKPRHGEINYPIVNASIGSSDYPSRTSFDTVYDERFTYYGFSIASGFLTNQDTKDFIVSSPRNTQYTQLGRVYIVNQINQKPTLYIDGEQFGEFFGYSVAAVDLNDDGWDDILVSAPVYSEPFRHELGRVIVYLNNKNSSFTKAGVIVGQASSGRFGVAMTTLGDINNDGYNDIAVSAPFEGSGVVYIYYGQQLDEAGSIINTTHQQRINGSDVASQVTNLTSVSTFGFSLSGSTDIDQNGYRDLVVGAHESQSVFILRTRPVAIVNVTITLNSEEVMLQDYDCLYQGKPIACFSVTVCSVYRGKGLSSGFNTKYVIREITPGIQNRLIFGNGSRVMTRGLTFTGEYTPVCDNILIYIENSTLFEDFKIRADMQEMVLDKTPVDTNINVSSFSHSPIISAEGYELKIPVVLECGSDGVCNPDLVLNIKNITYLTANNEVREELRVGGVQRISISLEFFNNGSEDSYNPYLTFTLPKQYLQLPRISPQSLFINCTDTTPLNDTYGIYTCLNVKNRLSFSDGVTSISLNVQVKENSLIGNEGAITIPMSIHNPLTNYSIEEDNVTSNNDVIANLPVVALSSYTVTFLPVEQKEYRGTGSNFDGKDASTLGERVSITVNFENAGPSHINGGQLDIYIPSNGSETGKYYYYYPGAIVHRGTFPPYIQCDNSTLNPSRYNVTDARVVQQQQSRRRKRRSESLLESAARISTRQTEPTVDCSKSMAGCIRLSCNLMTFPVTSAQIIITGYLDERFFNGKTSRYNLTAYAEVRITDGITNTDIKTTMGNDTVSIELLTTITSTEPGGIPWYVIVAPIVAALIFMIIIGILLYCFGFFSRKKKDDYKYTDTVQIVEGNVEQFAPDPFGDSAKAKEASATE